MNDDEPDKAATPLSMDKEWREWFSRWLHENAVLVVIGMLGWTVVLFTY